MRMVTPLGQDVAPLVDVPQGKLVALGSDVAVNPHAPVVTGDPAMDTQLENLRAMLCDSVLSNHAKGLRTKQIRLWPIERRWDGDKQSKIMAASKTRRDDHPAIQNLIQMAAALERIDAMDCMMIHPITGEEYVCSKLKMQQEEMRIDLFTKIQSALKDLDKSGMDALKLASDTIKSFHAMAQQWKIHVSKASVAPPNAQSELQRLAAIAFKKDPAP
jgi:hypothetical protein